MLKRIGLFLLTNFLVMASISIVLILIQTVFGLNISSGSLFGLIVLGGIVGMSGAFVSLFLSKWMAKSFYGVQIIDPNTNHPDLRRLVERVHYLAKRANLKNMPEVGIYESMDVNAFATGPSRNNSIVAVSSGLMQRMSDSEVDGVLAHEIAHIANGDMVTMTLVQGVVNAIVFILAHLIANVLSGNSERDGRRMSHHLIFYLAQMVLAPFGMIVVSYFSRIREFRADKGSSEYGGKENMILALRKLQLIYENPISDDPTEGQSSVAPTLMISETKKSSLLSLFRTHPSLDERIQALQSLR